MENEDFEEMIDLCKQEIIEILGCYCENDDEEVRKVHKKLIEFELEIIDGAISSDIDKVNLFSEKFDNLRKEYFKKLN